MSLLNLDIQKKSHLTGCQMAFSLSYIISMSKSLFVFDYFFSIRIEILLKSAAALITLAKSSYCMIG